MAFTGCDWGLRSCHAQRTCLARFLHESCKIAVSELESSSFVTNIPICWRTDVARDTTHVFRLPIQ
jgi:hypothetical protein